MEHRRNDWETKVWISVLLGTVIGCVVVIWMAIENEIDHYYRPMQDDVHATMPHPATPQNSEAEDIVRRWSYEKRLREGDDPDHLGNGHVDTE